MPIVYGQQMATPAFGGLMRTAPPPQARPVPIKRIYAKK